MGLRVEDCTGSIAYIPDHAPHQIGWGEHGVGELHQAAIDLASDVDVLVHDAQYTRNELTTRATWGHAAADYPIELAERCGARRVVLFHHDPSRTDTDLALIHAEMAAKTNIPVDLAVQGAVIDI